ncbi:MAG: type II toxin-antitoxin system Phd/YefM family antitoxin [bacterium]
MRFISVRQMRQNSAELWKQLKKEKELILTSNGKPIAIMAEIDEENLENVLQAFRRAKATLALEEMHTISTKAGTDKMTYEEIEEEINAVRRERKG